MKKIKLILCITIFLYKYKSFKGKYIKSESEKYYLSCFSLPIYYSLVSKSEIILLVKLKNIKINIFNLVMFSKK